MTSTPYVSFYENSNKVALNRAAKDFFPDNMVTVEYNSRFVVFTPCSAGVHARRIFASQRSYQFSAAELRNNLRLKNVRFPLRKVAGQNKYCIRLSEGEVMA